MDSRGKSPVRLAVDKNVPVPAYQQVVDGISDAVARGDLGSGERLPSVRNLAEDLGLNVNTVARAYRDLERAGVVDTMPGMGTFVAAPGRARTNPRPSALRSIPATGAPLPRDQASAPLATSWQDLLAAAHALAAAEGVHDSEFVARAAELAEGGGQAAPFLACAASSGEVADALRAMPADIASLSSPCSLDDLLDRIADGAPSAIITTFPALPKLRARLGDRADQIALIPIETEFAEATVRSLAGLPAAARLALVTVEKERWDEEANDVMKIVGRHRWLKMVVLENGERGLEDRLEQVDAVLYVPRAADVVEPLERPGQAMVELARQLTARARERLVRAAATGA